MRSIKKFTDEVGKYENDINSYIKSIKKLPLPYTGNKRKVLFNIYSAIKKHNIEFKSVIDAFSGSSSVSLLFKSMGKKVISNDILTSSFVNSVALVGAPIKMSIGEQEYLLNNKNPNKNNFVEDNYLGLHSNNDKICKYDKFTLQECKHLDSFRANIDDLSGFRLQCLGLTANFSVIQRLPFGSIDASHDIIKHRKKQRDTYGSGGSKHDRRIGIYYDSNMNLNFHKWFKKYISDFTSIRFNGSFKEEVVIKPFLENATNYRNMHTTPLCLKTNMNVIDLLSCSLSDNVDCIYFDPPYGGQSSDYALMYRFFEEYIYSKPIEDLSHCNKSKTFVNKSTYEGNFINMLNSAKKIPIWIFSYNNTSWKDINYIVGIISQYNRKVVIETLTDEYRYLYRKNNGRTLKGSEYIIFAY